MKIYSEQEYYEKVDNLFLEKDYSNEQLIHDLKRAYTIMMKAEWQYEACKKDLNKKEMLDDVFKTYNLNYAYQINLIKKAYDKFQKESNDFDKEKFNLKNDQLKELIILSLNGSRLGSPVSECDFMVSEYIKYNNKEYISHKNYVPDLDGQLFYEMQKFELYLDESAKNELANNLKMQLNEILNKKEECIKNNGEWKISGGMFGAEMCVKNYSDALEECNDSKECESKICLVTKNGNKCAPNNYNFGCYSYIVGGKTMGVCVD